MKSGAAANRYHSTALALLLIACSPQLTPTVRAPESVPVTSEVVPRAPSPTTDPVSPPSTAPSNADGEVAEGYDAPSSEALGDEPEGEALAPLPTDRPPTHPLERYSDAELEQLLQVDPSAVGSVSLGRPNAGSLFNAVPMPANEAWKLVSPKQAYGTEETVFALVHALRKVYETSPNTPVVSIGHLSAQHGGFLHPHRSHQSGRDVDLGFYYRDASERWYARTGPERLDLERTLSLFSVLVEETDIEMILVDRSLHGPLEQYGRDHGFSPELLQRLFHADGGRPPIVRHAPGHATHLHLRFSNPVARRSGERLATLLEREQLAHVPPKTLVHKAKRGDTLAKLAKRYGTTMHDIVTQNGMHGTQLAEGRSYQIPVAPTRSSVKPPHSPADIASEP